eukprot:CAMPEP_0184656822 /NCGR_PEP_ID=MMETSP0308-20130426/16781_1 /TAXON_ID=38269 /ORGANISM="Gloeochaete witrockiana, Strain SAG 46.84" /LENGTH=331 /DNA_ID=CAMNT_0027094119 /DNA_START=147 /DNA_END=1139 /DNA_ORIENTATION=+
MSTKKKGPPALQVQTEDARPQTPYSLSDTGTFQAGELAINRQGIIATPDKSVRPSTFTVATLDELKVMEVLGKGAGGTVHKAVHVPTMRVIALKTLTLSEENKHEEILKEIALLYSNTCPALISFHGAFYASLAFHIVLEYMDEGSLTDVMKRIGAIPEEAIGKIAAQVVVGLVYLHKDRHQVHRDLKPSNILLNRRGEAKIADFGVASNQLANSDAHTLTFAGTVSYMAPERLRGQQYSFASDIWSFGITLAECALGRFPYPAPKSFWDMINAVDQTPVPSLPADRFTPEFCNFVAICLQKDPTRRPHVTDLVGHPFIVRHWQSNKLDTW